MKEVLQELFGGKKLDKKKASELLTNISLGRYNNSQVTAFITVFLMREITPEELAGFRTALLDLCLKVDLSEFDTIDLCGTGGDGKNTFNISTLSSFVVAGAGYKVAKHGNYGVSSACGSSNVLEYLGYQFTADESLLKKQIDKANICFFHAPLFHPALKGVGPIRKELGMKTFFNMLGPLVNPAQPKQQIVGVYNLDIARLYHRLHEQLDKSFTIVHALDGYDEVSLTGDTQLITNAGFTIYTPEELGMKEIQPKEIHGGETVEEAAKIFNQILDGNGTEAQKSVIYTNAGLAIRCFKPDASIENCIQEAKKSLDSGNAKKALTTLLKTQ